MFRIALALSLLIPSLASAGTDLDPRILLELAKAKRLREAAAVVEPVAPQPIVPVEPDPVPAASFTLPSSGCPNGNCPGTTTKARWRLFK